MNFLLDNIFLILAFIVGTGFIIYLFQSKDEADSPKKNIRYVDPKLVQKHAHKKRPNKNDPDYHSSDVAYDLLETSLDSHIDIGGDWGGDSGSGDSSDGGGD